MFYQIYENINLKNMFLCIAMIKTEIFFSIFWTSVGVQMSILFSAAVNLQPF